jgi:hypothetical protein
MTKSSESIILCEGYHDRAFLRGWLLARRCEDWKDKSYPPNNNRPVKGKGHFVFQTPEPARRWVRVVPAGGDGKLLETAAIFVKEAGSRPIESIVLVWDGDDVAGAPSVSRRDSFASWAGGLGAQPIDPSRDFRLVDNPPTVQLPIATRLSLIVWRAEDPSAPDLPDKQTLERLACAAVREAHPDRCRVVKKWLDNRPSPPQAEKLHKTHAASHMAGWFSERGYEGFFDAVWEDGEVKAALESRLVAIGATRVVDELLG